MATKAKDAKPKEGAGSNVDADSEVDIPQTQERRKLSAWNKFVVRVPKNAHSDEIVEPYRKK